MTLNEIKNWSWLKSIFMAFALLNGVLLGTAGMMAFLLGTEHIKFSRMLWALVMCNVVYLIVLGVPILIALTLFIVYNLIRGEKIEIE